MTFEREIRLARLRGSSLRLALPVLFLAALAAAVTFLVPRFNLGWQLNTLYAVAGILAVFLWLIPALRFFGSSVEVTTVRLSIRSGVAGRIRQSVALEDIKGLERSGRVITLQLRGLEPELKLPAMARAKVAAAELERLIGRK